MNRRRIIFAVLGLAVLLAAAFVDIPVAEAVRSHGPIDKRSACVQVVRAMGNFTLTLGLAVVLTLANPLTWRRGGVVRYQTWRTGGFLCLCGMAGGFFYWIIKWLVGRTRPIASAEAFGFHPFAGGLRGLFVAENLSFPSGHTCLAFAMAAAFALSFPRWRAIFYFLAALVAAERVLELAHYPSDVVAGAGIGIASAHLVFWICNRLFDPVAEPGEAKIV